MLVGVLVVVLVGVQGCVENVPQLHITGVGEGGGVDGWMDGEGVLGEVEERICYERVCYERAVASTYVH